jgi:putative transposase
MAPSEEDMTYPTARLHRRLSIRLRGYDYAWAGMYFVTVCTHLKRCILGEVVEGEMRLNDAGRMVADTLASLPERFPSLKVDCSVVMPNHTHAILCLGGSTVPESSALGEIVRSWKAKSARAIRLGPDPSFGWQRNYYERILRDEEENDRIRRYIAENPIRWGEDENHPDATPEAPERSGGRPGRDESRPYTRRMDRV